MHSNSKEQEDKNRRLKKIDRAQKVLEELITKLNAYHLKTQKQITKAVHKICEKVEGLIDVKITKGRKQICKRIPSTRRRPGDPIYDNKWSFNYGLEWKINEQAAMRVSKTDGLFPLITNNHLLDAAEVLRM